MAATNDAPGQQQQRLEPWEWDPKHSVIQSTGDQVIVKLTSESPPTKLWCHSAKLKKASPVLERMLLALPAEQPLCLPDVTRDGFRDIMRFIYYGKVELKTFSAALRVLQLAKKFELPKTLEQQAVAQCWAFETREDCDAASFFYASTGVWCR